MKEYFLAPQQGQNPLGGRAGAQGEDELRMAKIGVVVKSYGNYYFYKFITFINFEAARFGETTFPTTPDGLILFLPEPWRRRGTRFNVDEV